LRNGFRGRIRGQVTSRPAALDFEVKCRGRPPNGAYKAQQGGPKPEFTISKEEA
jgi:hypothetical protein